MKKYFHAFLLAFLITSQVFLPVAIPATLGYQIDFLLSQVRTASGGVLAGGHVHFYEAGTTTNKTVWTDVNKSAAAANPYQLTANGTALLYGDGLYRIVIHTSTDVAAYDFDNVRYEDFGGALTRVTSITGDYTGTISGFTDLITRGPWVDVRAYGAVGDGIADDTAAVQYAMNLGRRSIFFPPGQYVIDNVVVPEGVKRIFGINSRETVIKGVSAGTIFTLSAPDTVEIDHLTFTGTGCTALKASAISSVFVKAHIHNNHFDRSLADGIYGVFVLANIEENTFGYVALDTLAATHRHIYSVGDGTYRTNAIFLRNNRFNLAKGTYSVEINGGTQFVAEGNNWEENEVIPVSIRGLQSVEFRGNWFESNEGLYEVDLDDSDLGDVPNRYAEFRGNHWSPHANITHLINITYGLTVPPKIYFTGSTSGANFAGKYITKSASGDDYYVAEYGHNTLTNYSGVLKEGHTTYKLNDAFFARKTSENLNFTGDNTVYTIIYDTEDMDYLSVYATGTGIHTAAFTGLYSYNVGLRIYGITSSHTVGLINLVTTARTYTIRINPYLVADVDGGLQITFPFLVPMTAENTAYVTLAIYNGTKVVDMTGSDNWFSGSRVGHN